MKLKWTTFLAYIEAIGRANKRIKNENANAEWRQGARQRLGLK